MGKDFNWDQFEKAPAAKSDFDWNQFEVAAEPEAQAPQGPQESTGKQWARNAIDTVVPAAGGILGGIAGVPAAGPSFGTSVVAGGALGYAGGKEVAEHLKHYLLDDEYKEQTPQDIALRGVKNVRDGAMMEVGGQAVAKGLTGGFNMVANAAPNLSRFAEKAAVSATGATGKQASEFSDDAGRQLLDRKIVQFGDNQVNIANKAGKAVNQANQQIDDSLAALEAQGVKVDGNAIYSTIRQKITDLKKNPAQANVAKQLEDQLEALVASTDAKGTTKFGIKEAEQVKRDYNKMAGNWANPEQAQTGKELYQTWRHGVEDVAQAADPATAQLFKEGKQSYGLLAPIEEAAARRASQVQQHPAGGFLDMVSAGGAFLGSGGNPLVAASAPVARRFIAPRISSSVAVTADKAAKNLDKLGVSKLKGVGKNAAPGITALENATVSKLQNLGPHAPIQKVPLKAAEQDQDSPSAPQNEANPKPLKGQEKWANDGFDKALDHADPKTKEELLRNKGALLSSPKAKELLAQASDLKPKSKAMERMLVAIRLHANSSRGNA